MGLPVVSHEPMRAGHHEVSMVIIRSGFEKFMLLLVQKGHRKLDTNGNNIYNKM